MKLEYLNQSSTHSHIQNGNFSQGTANWFGSFIKHRRVLGADNPVRPRAAPEYGAEISAVDEQFYPDGIRPGIHQFVDRADTYRYPSRRRAGGIELIPFTSQRAVLKVLGNGSTLDERPLTSLPAVTVTPRFEDYFQHPFVFRDAAGAVGVTPASDIPWTDDELKDRTKVYKAHRTLFNYDGNLGSYSGPGDVLPSAAPPSTAIDADTVGRFSYHAQIIAPVTGDSFSSIIDHTTSSVESIVYKGAPTAYYIDIVGDLDALLPFFKPGDIFESLLPEQFSMEIYQIKDLRQDPVTPSDVLRLMVYALKIYGLKIANNGVEVDKGIIQWRTFRRSTGTAVIEKDLIAYDYTLATTYKISEGYQEPANSELQFLTLNAADKEMVGFGNYGERIPQVGTTEVTYFPTQVTLPSGLSVLEADPSWRRELRHFYRESRTPIDGRLMVSIAPTNLGNDTTTNYRPVRFSYNQDVNNPRVVVTAIGTIDTSIDYEAVRINKTYPTTTETTSWVDRFIQGSGASGFNSLVVESIIIGLPVVDENATTRQTIQITLIADPVTIGPPDPDHPYDYNLLSSSNTLSERFELYRLIPRGVALVSDICLYPGNYTQRFEFIELAGTADSRQRLTLSNHLLDELQHTSNELDGALPKGAVILYAGGQVCPAGFKRVDALAGSESAGVGYGEMPYPDSITYDEEIDRTEVVWNALYLPVLNERKEPVLLNDFPTAYEFEYKTSPNDPNPKILDFELPPVLQAPQPGLSLRVKETTSVPTNTLNPLYVSTRRGKAIALGAPSLPVFTPAPSDSIFNYIELPSHPNILNFTSNFAIEMWFTFTDYLEAALNDTAEYAVIYQRLEARSVNNQLRLFGFDIIVRRNFKIEFRIFYNSVSRSAPFYKIECYSNTWNETRVTLNEPIHLVARLKFNFGNTLNPDASVTLNTYSNLYPVINVRQGKHPIYGGALPTAFESTPLAAFISLPVDGFIDDILVDGPAYIGRPPVTGNTNIDPPTGTPISVDSFRIFDNISDQLFAGELEEVKTLWNLGDGLYTLPEGLYQRLRTAHYFDTDGEYIVPNLAPNIVSQALPYAKIVSNVGTNPKPVKWNLGHLIGVASTKDFNEKHYIAPFEKLCPAHLITDLKYDTSDEFLTYSSATAFKASGSQFGQGYGNVAYPVVITEDEITAATGETVNQGIREFPPPGDIVNKVNEFIVNGVSGVVTAKAFRFSGNRAAIYLRIENDDAFSNYLLSNLKIGDVFQVTWDYPSSAPTTHILRYDGRVKVGKIKVFGIKISSGSTFFQFSRYDRRPFRARIPKKPYLFDFPTFGVNCTIRPASLYGRGVQTYDAGTRTFGFPGMTAKFFPGVSSTNKGAWAFVPFESQLRLMVQGNFQPNPGDNVYLEPSGYLRYDTPGMDFGGGGHSHKVLQSEDDIGVDNLVPRVDPQGPLKTTPRTRVASEHHHGILPAYRYPLPAFKFFSICEKL